MLSRSLLAAGIVGGLLAAAHPAAAQWPNQFGTYQNSPQVYAPSGTYLGNLNGNQFDPNSVANPYGPHGSPFAPNSIHLWQPLRVQIELRREFEARGWDVCLVAWVPRPPLGDHGSLTVYIDARKEGR